MIASADMVPLINFKLSHLGEIRKFRFSKAGNRGILKSTAAKALTLLMIGKNLPKNFEQKTQGQKTHTRNRKLQHEQF